jgi:opacity protein-like surface antigen
MHFISIAAAASALAAANEGSSLPSSELGHAYLREPGLERFLAAADEDDADDRLGRDGLYIQLNGGVTTTTKSDGPDEEIDFDEGFEVAAAFGTRFDADDGDAMAFDVEVEAVYTDQDADNEGVLEAVTDVTMIGGFLNGLIDFALGDKFSFYGGAGIGLAMLDIGTNTDSVNDFDEEDGPFLAWQAKAGLRLWASQETAWSLGYRFLNVDDAEIDDDLGGAGFDLETQQHIVELSVRFQL